MADKVHRIHSLPDDSPWAGRPAACRLRRASAHRPRASTACSRSSAPSCSRTCAASDCVIRTPRPAQIVRILERRYLAAVTTGGAAVGATAVVPGIGTGVTLALSGVETVGFLEATTLFAQSVAEVHGIPVADPDRARALVLTLMLGKEGVDLVAQLAGQAAGQGRRARPRTGASSSPRRSPAPPSARSSIGSRRTFIHQFAARGGASWIGKALPFGIGAVVGGAGNHILGRRVLVNSRRAFGAPPAAAARGSRAAARHAAARVGRARARSAAPAAPSRAA